MLRALVFEQEEFRIKCNTIKFASKVHNNLRIIMTIFFCIPMLITELSKQMLKKPQMSFNK